MSYGDETEKKMKELITPIFERLFLEENKEFVKNLIAAGESIEDFIDREIDELLMKDVKMEMIKIAKKMPLFGKQIEKYSNYEKWMSFLKRILSEVALESISKIGGSAIKIPFFDNLEKATRREAFYMFKNIIKEIAFEEINKVFGEKQKELFSSLNGKMDTGVIIKMLIDDGIFREIIEKLKKNIIIIAGPSEDKEKEISEESIEKMLELIFDSKEFRGFIEELLKKSK